MPARSQNWRFYHESKFDRWNAISREVLSLNEYESMKELEDPESTRDFRTISEGVGCQRECEVSPGLERADALRVMVFA